MTFARQGASLLAYPGITAFHLQTGGRIGLLHHPDPLGTSDRVLAPSALLLDRAGHVGSQKDVIGFVPMLAHQLSERMNGKVVTDYSMNRAQPARRCVTVTQCPDSSRHLGHEQGYPDDEHARPTTAGLAPIALAILIVTISIGRKAMTPIA